MPSRLQAARCTDRDTSTERGLAFLSKPGAMPTGNEAQCLTDQNLHDGARCIEFGEVDVRRCYSGLNKRFVSCLRSRYERDHVVRNFADLMRSFVEKASSPYSDVRSFRSARYVLLCENETHRAIAARRHLIEPERVNNGALRQNFLKRDRFAKLRYWVERGMVPVLDRHAGELLSRGLELVDIAGGVHRVP